MKKEVSNIFKCQKTLGMINDFQKYKQNFSFIETLNSLNVISTIF